MEEWNLNRRNINISRGCPTKIKLKLQEEKNKEKQLLLAFCKFHREALKMGKEEALEKLINPFLNS